MYLAVATTILGQALWFCSGWLLGYAGMVFAVTAGFVIGYEEPTLRRQFGASYTSYCEAVPRWLPRRPAPPTWSGDAVSTR